MVISMLQWIKRWIDWLRNDRLPLSRIRRGGHSFQVRYDTIGRTRHELPIPWTAESLTLEVQLRLPPPARRKIDYSLKLANGEPVTADAVRPGHANLYHVVFRFPTPRSTTMAEVLWKLQPLARITIPVLTREEFLNGLSTTNPMLSVRLGGQIVPARRFMATGNRGLIASVLLQSSCSLEPIAELGLCVIFRNERTGRGVEIPLSMTAEQLGSTSTLLLAARGKLRRMVGQWSVIWRAGGRDLAVQRAEAVAVRPFEESVHLVDVRFAVAEKTGAIRMVRQLPASTAVDHFGPCFLLASREVGLVGLCKLAVFATAPGDDNPTLLVEKEFLVTDSPTVFAPGLFRAADLTRVGGFELRLNSRVLGTASLSPVPPARLTAEGGFKPMPGFTWTAAAEEELLDRLGRLGYPN